MKVHLTWFAAVFVLGVVFTFALPPFQGNDEWPHWVRTWTVAQGDLECDTVPHAAYAAMALFPVNKATGVRISWSDVKHALKAPPRGSTPTSVKRTSACGYAPTAYLLPAMVARLVAGGTKDFRMGGIGQSFFAARLVNWLCVSAAALWLLFALPWARGLVLLFYSVPEVVQQSVVLNNDALLFVLTFALMVLTLRPATWRTLAWVALVVGLLTLTKPVFALLGLMAVPGWLELRKQRPDLRKDVLLILALFVMPIVLRKAWTAYCHYDEVIWLPPWNVSPEKQIAFLKAHPLHLVTLMFAQLKDTLGHGLMQGSWTSILGAFGASAFEMPMIGYWLILLAIPIALYSDVARGDRPVEVGPQQKWAWRAALLGILAIFPAVVLAMYLLFSSVGAPSVNGVQGRYYLTPLLLLGALGLRRLHRRQWRGNHLIATGVAGGLMIFSVMIAIRALFDYYWKA
jgi:uncharacterized membrane protein